MVFDKTLKPDQKKALQKLQNTFTAYSNMRIKHENDLDEWLQYYNNERTHQGKMCCGRTPIQNFSRWQTALEGKVF